MWKYFLRRQSHYCFIAKLCYLCIMTTNNDNYERILFEKHSQCKFGHYRRITYPSP